MENEEYYRHELIELQHHLSRQKSVSAKKVIEYLDIILGAQQLSVPGLNYYGRFPLSVHLASKRVRTHIKKKSYDQEDLA